MKRTMKKLLYFLAAAVTTLSMAASCILNFGGNGAVWVGNCTETGIDYTEVREVGPFREVATSLPANVYYVQADKQEVRVESTEEFAPKVQTTVEDGKLSLKMEPGRYSKLILRVVVSSPDIEMLSVSGSGNLVHEGDLHASGGLSLKVSGSGDLMAGRIDSKDFSARCSGSGRIRAEGVRCDDFDGTVSGSGSMRLGSVSCDGFAAAISGSGGFSVDALTAKGDATARISGSGGIHLDEVTVDGDMELKTSGSGGIRVNGSCRDVTAVTSGSGSISGGLEYRSINTKKSGSGHVSL